jgi:PPM family protein phosphatase
MSAEKNFAVRQSRGARSQQEDAFALSEMVNTAGKVNGLLVVVADGMGGHASGERASELAVKHFAEAFHRARGNPEKRLLIGLTAANEAIKEELKREPAYQGMGTTLVAATVTPAGVEWVSVGDSPLYLLRGKTLKRLNADHSLRPVLNEMVERGQISTSPARTSGNLLRAALMGEEIALTDQSRRPVILQDGDLILVATDGIHTLNNQEIAAACADAAAADAQKLATRLLQAVLDAGNPTQDNTTIALVKMGPAANDLSLPL